MEGYEGVAALEGGSAPQRRELRSISGGGEGGCAVGMGDGGWDWGGGGIFLIFRGPRALSEIQAKIGTKIAWVG